MNLFISHASEDKDGIARPLADELLERGYEVWYDEYSLKLGDSLNEEIEKGLASCDFGIVIFSPNFFAKNWTKKELSGLIAKEMTSGKKFILPVWHQITKDQLITRAPSLLDKIGVDTKLGLDFVAERIVSAVSAR